MKFWLVCWLFFVCNVFAVTPPSADEFYKGPDGFENQPLGTILRWRETPYNLRSVYFPIKIKNSWDILVRSEDSHGNATAVVSTIIEPFNADPKKLVAFNIAQDSSNFDCSPTYAIAEGAPVFDNIEAEFEFSLYAGAALLSEGYYVVTTSYETTADYKAAFVAGRLAGTNILNSLKATLKTGEFTGLDNPDVVLWGYSGGALATMWTTAMMHDYAPELMQNVIGAAAGGLPSNVSTTLVATDNTVFAGLVANGVNGLMNEYPEIYNVVKEDMTQNDFDDFLQGQELCIAPSILHFAGANFFEEGGYFKSGLGFLEKPMISEMLTENTLAIKDSEKPNIPVFIYHGKLDQIVPYVNSERVYDRWCELGVSSLEFATDVTLGHISGFAVGVPAAAAWIKNRFDGVAPVSGCKSTLYFTLLQYPGASPALIDQITSFAGEYLGEQIGKREITNFEASLLQKAGLLSDTFLAKVIFAIWGKLLF